MVLDLQEKPYLRLGVSFLPYLFLGEQESGVVLPLRSMCEALSDSLSLLAFQHALEDSVTSNQH